MFRGVFFFFFFSFLVMEQYGNALNGSHIQDDGLIFWHDSNLGTAFQVSVNGLEQTRSRVSLAGYKTLFRSIKNRHLLFHAQDGSPCHGWYGYATAS
jgi:hypothetical protein